MDMYKKREMRKNKIKNDNQENLQKNIPQWFPRTHGQSTKRNKAKFKANRYSVCGVRC